MLIFHFNPRIFHRPLTFTLHAGECSNIYNRASINMRQDTKATEFSTRYSTGHTCNSLTNALKNKS